MASDKELILQDLQRWYEYTPEKKIGRFSAFVFFIKRREFRVTYVYRKRHYHQKAKHWARKYFWTLATFLTNTTVYISGDAEIGGGLYLVHAFGTGIGKAKIGNHCRIHHNVTIGANYKNTSGNQYPTIGDNVVISPGAVIVGPITVGSNVLIAANAVVTKDVPNNCIVGGIPAKMIGKYDHARFD